MFGPNITGDFLGTQKAGWVTSNGCFFHKEPSSLGNWEGGINEGSQTFRMEASRNSSIFNNSSTVQPPAFFLLPCIKI